MKKALLFIVFVLIGLQFSFAQTIYPQNYFRSPLDIPLVLSGTFGELRSNHFHSGLDIKTQQQQGLKVYAAADGYVSRIKISHYGYGKALYVTHPNGYTTVYAHLKSFEDTIERYIKALQYEAESYEIEVFPKPSELKVTKGDIIALSGNTGSSGGPHLHFEIRDNQERPINPMLFGLSAKDSKKPHISKIYAYPKNKHSLINGENKRVELRLIPHKNGDYSVENIDAYGEIGFGIETFDQLDYANNRNGVSNIQSFFNGNKNFEIDFKRFSFDESKYINRLIDYEIYKTDYVRIQKLFVEPNNPLSMYKDVKDNGYLNIEDSTASVFKIRVKDFSGNDSWITIPISGKKIKPKPASNDIKPLEHIYADQINSLQKGNFSVFFPKNTFYDDLNIDFNVDCDTLLLHRDVVPLMKHFTISYDIGQYKGEDKEKLFIAKLYGYYKKPIYLKTTRKGDVLSARSKTLGSFALYTDLEPPTITPINFTDGKWMSKNRFLKLKIHDELSGISNYRATVNGKWILMEYDPKTKMLIHDFNDKIVTETENKLKVIVTDNVGNSSTFEATFYRK